MGMKENKGQGLVKRFLKFIVPSILSMWIFAFYTIVDGFFVAKGVGPEALAAVNLSMPFNNFVFAVGLLFATGASTMISFALGRGNLREAREIFSRNLAVVTILGLLITVAVLFHLEEAAAFLGATDMTLEYVKSYVGWIAVFAVFFIVSYNLEVQVKANGAPHLTAIGVASCGITNVVLDYLFVMKMGMGIDGAALATGLSQVISTSIFLLYFATHREKLRIQRFSWKFGIYKQIIEIGIPNCFMELGGGLTIFLFNAFILRVIGEEGIICYTVLAYIFTFAGNTMSGITQGCQPLISFFCGAGQQENFQKVLRYGIITVFLLSSLMVFGIQLAPQALVTVFLERENAGLFDYTVAALRLYCLSFFIMGYNILISGFFTAIDRSGYSFFISLCRSFVLLLVSLAVMSRLFGENGIWLASLASEGMCLAVTILFYKDWKKHKAVIPVDGGYLSR